MDADSFYQQCWGEFHKLFAKGDNELFMMTEGKYIDHHDFSVINNNKHRAGFNTFTLANDCAACEINYNPTGSIINTLWDQLLNKGRGPEAGPDQ